MAARRCFLFLAFAALLCTATLVHCQQDEAGDSETEVYYEEVVVDEPAAAAEPVKKAAAAEPVKKAADAEPVKKAADAEPVKKAADAAGSPIDQYKVLAEEYLAKATEIGKEYAAQAQEIATKYVAEGMKVLESTLDKLGVKKSSGKTEL